MKKCMFCNREHNKLYGNAIKYCEHCKKEMDISSANAMITRRKEELK